MHVLPPHRPSRNVREAAELYSTEHLRELWHGRPIELGAISILLSGIYFSHAQVAEEIRWREWWKGFWYFLGLIVAVVGALAAVLALNDSLHWPFTGTERLTPRSVS
jgi:hypothetical protein